MKSFKEWKEKHRKAIDITENVALGAIGGVIVVTTALIGFRLGSELQRNYDNLMIHRWNKSGLLKWYDINTGAEITSKEALKFTKSN